jgi:hypothetical protein
MELYKKEIDWKFETVNEGSIVINQFEDNFENDHSNDYELLEVEDKTPFLN